MSLNVVLMSTKVILPVSNSILRMRNVEYAFYRFAYIKSKYKICFSDMNLTRTSLHLNKT